MAPRSNGSLSQVPFFEFLTKNLIALLRGQLKNKHRDFTRSLHTSVDPLHSTNPKACLLRDSTYREKNPKNLKGALKALST